MRQKEFWDRPAAFGMKTALFGGILAHLFGIMNYLSNYDDISMMPYGYGAGMISGRWFLELVGTFFEKNGAHYNLPVLNGVVFIALLSITAGILVSALRIQEKSSAAIISLLFVTFPSVTATMFFRYTVIYYGIAILLAVLAAWVMRNCRHWVLLSACCTALALGIYQAYVPITIGMMVLMLLQDTLEGQEKLSAVIVRGLNCCAALVLGLLLYYGCLKILLEVMNVSLSDYQGINEMGTLNLKDLPGLVWKAFFSACTFAIRDYCNLAHIGLLRKAYLLLEAAAAGAVVYAAYTQRKKVGNVLIAAALCLVFPLAVNFVVVMCPASNIYTLMVLAFVLIPCVPFAVCSILRPLHERAHGLFVKGIGLVAAVVIGCNIYCANVNYSALYFANRQVENYLSTMIAQVRMTEGYTGDADWVLIGENIEDPLLESLWDTEGNYGGNANMKKLLNIYSRDNWIENYIGYRIPYADETTRAKILEKDEVLHMPCWPDAGSIRVVDHVVVIKLEEPTE